jgi:hypothetical protein
MGIRKEKKDAGEKFIGEVSLAEGGMGHGTKLFPAPNDEDGWPKQRRARYNKRTPPRCWALPYLT